VTCFLKKLAVSAKGKEGAATSGRGKGQERSLYREEKRGKERIMT